VTLLAIVAVVALLMLGFSLRQKSRSATPVPVPGSASSGSLVLPKLTLPDGWSVFASGSVPSKVPGMVGVQETVVLTEAGKRVASVTLTTVRHESPMPLADAAKAMVVGETRTTMGRGIPWSFTEPTARTWLGHPAMQYDGVLDKVNHLHQRSVITEGSATTACTVTYLARTADFETHVPMVENILSQFVCTG
jgi:hypothetical protein